MKLDVSDWLRTLLYSGLPVISCGFARSTRVTFFLSFTMNKTHKVRTLLLLLSLSCNFGIRNIFSDYLLLLIVVYRWQGFIFTPFYPLCITKREISEFVEVYLTAGINTTYHTISHVWSVKWHKPMPHITNINWICRECIVMNRVIVDNDLLKCLISDRYTHLAWSVVIVVENGGDSEWSYALIRHLFTMTSPRSFICMCTGSFIETACE